VWLLVARVQRCAVEGEGKFVLAVAVKFGALPVLILSLRFAMRLELCFAAFAHCKNTAAEGSSASDSAPRSAPADGSLGLVGTSLRSGLQCFVRAL
jgi:hypothetical protein